MDTELAKQLHTLEDSHLQPLVRADRDRLAAILHESFTEIGASGRVFTRDDILNNLPAEPAASRTLEDFNARPLSTDIALTTYAVSRPDIDTGQVHRSRRSSIWTRESGIWQLLFHQGTPL